MAYIYLTDCSFGKFKLSYLKNDEICNNQNYMNLLIRLLLAVAHVLQDNGLCFIKNSLQISMTFTNYQLRCCRRQISIFSSHATVTAKTVSPGNLEAMNTDIYEGLLASIVGAMITSIATLASAVIMARATKALLGNCLTISLSNGMTLIFQDAESATLDKLRERDWFQNAQPSLCCVTMFCSSNRIVYPDW